MPLTLCQSASEEIKAIIAHARACAICVKTNPGLVESGTTTAARRSHCSWLSVIGRASLARENEAGGSWGQEVHILHVNI